PRSGQAIGGPRVVPTLIDHRGAIRINVALVVAIEQSPDRVDRGRRRSVRKLPCLDEPTEALGLVLRILFCRDGGSEGARGRRPDDPTLARTAGTLRRLPDQRADLPLQAE